MVVCVAGVSVVGVSVPAALVGVAVSAGGDSLVSADGDPSISAVGVGSISSAASVRGVLKATAGVGRAPPVSGEDATVNP